MRPNKDRRTEINLYGLLLIPLLCAAAALAQATAQAQGWYPAVGGATQSAGTSAGVTQYNETFTARIEKLSEGTRPQVTAGRVEATAQIIIRVQ